MIPRLLKKYREEIVLHLMEEIGRRNRLAVPRLKKIVINMGVGRASEDIKILEAAVADLARISGQKPAIRRSRKAISNFKIKRGDAVGCSVTLRGARMYEFFDRLVNVALPRVRDFRGVSGSSFDGRGNYALGIAEQAIFPEIELDKIVRVQGMDIIVVTTASSNSEARALLKALGMPFRE